MPKLAELNRMNRAEFTTMVAPVFEHSAWVAARTCSQRPFSSRESLHVALCETVRQASEAEKMALIRAHPDLAERASLTAASEREQASAGLDRASGSEIAKLRELSQQYRDRFDIPFIICARLHKKEEIPDVIRSRLTNSREQEIENALHEIFTIADLRLGDLVE
jgi:2-oxo-4-hydroxy-4-carboxy-5-ureidoimidazoline decarboxylase